MSVAHEWIIIVNLTILGLRNIHNLLQHQKKYNKLF